MHENRETSGGFPSESGPVREGDSHKPDRHAAEESHSAVVPMKPPNHGAQAPAEVVEERALVKENSVPSRTRPTPSGKRVSQG
jgi:hypothetical protein